MKPSAVDLYNLTVCGDVTATLRAKATDCEHIPCVVEGFDSYNLCLTGNLAKTIQAERSDSEHIPCVVLAIENDPTIKIDSKGVAFSLRSREFKDPQIIVTNK